MRRRHHQVVSGSVERLGMDNQPYLGGQRTIATAGTTGGNPGGWGLANPCRQQGRAMYRALIEASVGDAIFARVLTREHYVNSWKILMRKP